MSYAIIMLSYAFLRFSLEHDIMLRVCACCGELSDAPGAQPDLGGTTNLGGSLTTPTCSVQSGCTTLFLPAVDTSRTIQSQMTSSVAAMKYTLHQLLTSADQTPQAL
jgi:hypothetical protein